MFSIYDGRDKFYQWDKERKLIVYDDSITEVHFANCLCSDAHVCKVSPMEEFGLVNVPDDLLTEYIDIRVWAYDGQATKHEKVFEVVRRTKPADYIYTPEEMKTWDKLDERVEAVEENMVGRKGFGQNAEKFNTAFEAYGDFSHVEGKSSSAYGMASHAEGTNTPDDDTTTQSEVFAFTNPYTHKQETLMVNGPRAQGTGSHAEGANTLAFGHSSHAEGCQTQAIGGRSHAEGSGTKATNHRAHAEGAYTTASGRSSHAEGESGTASGTASHSEGLSTRALNDAAHSEGYDTEAKGYASHAEGYQTKAIEGYSHAEGRKSQATGYDSHAEGYNTLASGHQSHAEGEGCKATIDRAHAEGCMTEANGYDSHSEGKGTVANGSQQHAQGRWNVRDTENKYAHIVGGGTSDSDRKNIHTLDWYGNAWFEGGIVLTAANGKRYKITVADDGTLKTTLFVS